MSRASRTSGRGWLPRLSALGLLMAMLLIPFAPAALVSSAFASQDARSVTLGFGERYGDAQRKHLGCDVAAEPGEEVLAPVDGTVSFVGWVPRDEGVRVRAVTIRDGAGALVSVSPLAEYSVSLGDAVRIGSTLGTVAETGDPSTPDPHVHLSLRVNDRYMNPANLVGLLFAPHVPDPRSESSQPHPVEIPEPASPKASVGARTPAPSTTPVLSIDTATQPAASPVAVNQTSAMSHPAGTVVKGPGLQVASASRLNKDGSTQHGTSQTAKAPENAVEPASGSVDTRVAFGRTLIAWVIFGVGTALGLGALLIRHFCQTAKLAGWLTGIFAVRGNR